MQALLQYFKFFVSILVQMLIHLFRPGDCLMDCNKPTQQYYHVPFDWLQQKDNLIVLFEEMGGNPHSVQLVKRIPSIACDFQQQSATQVVSVDCQPNSLISSVDFGNYFMT